MGMAYGSIRHTTSGRVKKKVQKRVKRVMRAVSVDSTESYRRPTPEYPSGSDTVGVAARVESPRYTGTLIKGIGTMHKSNAVPIINKEEMRDIARMRR